jgi:hypothetical protein
VPVDVNGNQSAPTLVQMLASKKRTQIAAFRYGLQELERDLARMCRELDPARYALDTFKDDEGKHYTCEGLAKNIMAECKRKLQAHEELGAEEFAKDETFRRMVTEMLDVKTMAKSKLTLWLEDRSQYIIILEDVSIKDAHQQLLAFLSRRMQHEEPDTRRLTATQMCKLKGLLDRSVDDSSDGLDLWKTRLMSAAAEGISSNDLELLLEAGSVRRLGEGQEVTCSGASEPTSEQKQHVLSEALMKSAEFGHVHCIQVLTESKAECTTETQME